MYCFRFTDSTMVRYDPLFSEFDFDFFIDTLIEPPPDLKEEEVVNWVLGADSVMSGSPRAKHWCFTLNNYTDADVDRILSLENEVVYIVIGREVSSTGTPHLQGFVSWRGRYRLNQCVSKIPRAHFTVTRLIGASIEYCKKDGDYEERGTPPKGQGARSDLDAFKDAVKGGVLNMAVLRDTFSVVCSKHHKFCEEFVRDHIPQRKVALYPLRRWQQELYNDLQLEPDDRTIVFCVDLVGNTGKSWFCHYYCQINQRCQVVLPGKKADMAMTLKHDSRVVFFDAPRSKQGEFIQYDFLEDIKNGYVFSPKYSSFNISMSKCHIVVMMNEMPDMSKLSQDRYDIRQITNE